jgi:hypothetical protein
VLDFAKTSRQIIGEKEKHDIGAHLQWSPTESCFSAAYPDPLAPTAPTQRAKPGDRVRSRIWRGLKWVRIKDLLSKRGLPPSNSDQSRYTSSSRFARTLGDSDGTCTFSVCDRLALHLLCDHTPPSPTLTLTQHLTPSTPSTTRCDARYRKGPHPRMSSWGKLLSRPSSFVLAQTPLEADDRSSKG